MNAPLDSLLNDFLIYTLSLEKRVLDEYSEPEEWLELLSKRQELIDHISELLEQGVSFTDTQKKVYLQPAYEADKKIAPLMDVRKRDLESDMVNMKKTQAVNQQYGEYGSSYSAYGAFFDKKK
ncbi:hypothetical protein AB4Z17_06160 [Paenibacillus sp. TAF43_2]|uniref:hypothetical protein n=1 Tax=Paenibacillus sp. TAF43_2 TaxID=3233069 RepID=UPI003F98FED5